jgi:hypothetical protein
VAGYRLELVWTLQVTERQQPPSDFGSVLLSTGVITSSAITCVTLQSHSTQQIIDVIHHCIGSVLRGEVEFVYCRSADNLVIVTKELLTAASTTWLDLESAEVALSCQTSSNGGVLR